MKRRCSPSPLGMLAGAFIGLGSLFYVIVVSDPGLGRPAKGSA